LPGREQALIYNGAGKVEPSRTIPGGMERSATGPGVEAGRASDQRN